jgi:hypothetical protein
MEAVERYDEGLPVLADDTLIHVAKQAEARIDAVVKIKQLALKVTNANDWVDQDGKPYLMASGSEKIANLFNISWRVDEPTMEQEQDGTVTYNYRGTFTLAGRSIDIEGSRSSRDTFFKKYEYVNGQRAGEKPLDRRDLKMAAFTNLLGNGITRVLGIRNLTYEDLQAFAGIKKEQVKGVKYNKQEKPPTKEPQRKSEQKEPAPEGEKSVKDKLHEELSLYCQFEDGTVDMNMYASVLKEISQFKENGPFISDLFSDKISDKWAGTSLGKLREKLENKPE